jgi:hypothetical protein
METIIHCYGEIKYMLMHNQKIDAKTYEAIGGFMHEKCEEMKRKSPDNATDFEKLSKIVFSNILNKDKTSKLLESLSILEETFQEIE